MNCFAFLALCFAVPFASAQAQGQAPSDQGGMGYPKPVPGSGVTRSIPLQTQFAGASTLGPGWDGLPEGWAGQQREPVRPFAASVAGPSTLGPGWDGLPEAGAGKRRDPLSRLAPRLG